MNTKNLKPFDLEAALRGEPVMLRDGSKAFIRWHETELNTDEHRKLVGYTSIGLMLTWCEDGSFVGRLADMSMDIIGMYPKTRIVNGFEVPAPETKQLNSGVEYYLVALHNDIFYRYEIWQGYSQDKLWLERGLVFLNKDDAIANAKAMLGINPYEEATNEPE